MAKRSFHNLPKLCDRCQLRVADETLGRHDVINVLANVDRMFCLYLENTIITREARQKILGARCDSEALEEIRRALHYSIDPRKLDKVLQVLSIEQVGQKIHAEIIEKYYHEEIRKHRRCKEWDTTNEGGFIPVQRVDEDFQLEEEKRVKFSYEEKKNINTIEDISTLEFSPDERAKLVSCKLYGIVPIGESGVGKSSLVKSLILKGSHLTSEQDRTVVAQVLSWNPEEKEDSIFLIYDIGGQENYKSTSQCFQINSPTTVRLLCHDVNSTNFEASIQWMKETQTVAPESKLLLCLTKVDTLSNNVSENNKIQTCLDSFSLLIEHEIQQTQKSQKLTAKGTTNWSLYENHLHCYQTVQKQIKSNPILLSCKPGYEHLLNSFREYLLQLGDSEQTFMLDETDKEFFLRIGRLGLKDPMVDHGPEIPATHSSPTPVASTHCTSHATQPMEENVSSVQVESGTESEENSTQESGDLRQQYVLLDEALPIFSDILQEKNIVVSNPMEEMKRSLENLNKKGLLRYFLGDKDLEQIVFHDISTLTNVLRCIFHHNRKDFLIFENVDCEVTQRLYESSRYLFNHEVKLLQKNGILSMRLLEVLLLKINCLIKPKIVAKLLAELTIAYTYDYGGKLQVFVPYFVETPCDNFESHQREFLQCDEAFLSLHTVLKGEFPLRFFHNFIVKIICEYRDSYITQSRVATWHTGLYLTLGRNSAKFMIHYNSKKEIECCVQAKISGPEDSGLKGHCALWECIKFFGKTAKDTGKFSFPGLPFDFILTCTQCKLLSITESESEGTVCEWDIENQLLSDVAENTETYSCNSSCDIPAALLAPLPKDKQKAMKFLHCLHDHLQKMTLGNSKQLIYDDLPRLPDGCLLCVAKQTINRQDVIEVFKAMEFSFCNGLNIRIITSDRQQEIREARNHGDALGLFCQALNRSLDPLMLNTIIRVLSNEKTGQPLHAQRLKECYRQELEKHKCDHKCASTSS